MNNYDNHNSDRAYYHGDVDADSMSSGGGRVSTGSGGGRCSLGSSDSSLCHSGEDCSSGGGAAAVHYTVTPKTVTAATATAATISAQKPAESGTDSSGPAQSCTQTRQQLQPSPHHGTSTATSASSSSTTSGTTSSSVGREWCLSDFEIGATLGQGAFGAVWLAREKKSQFLTALKVHTCYNLAPTAFSAKHVQQLQLLLNGTDKLLHRIRKSLLVESGMEMQLRREVEIQGQLRHRNILRMLGIFSDSAHIYLILEFARCVLVISQSPHVAVYSPRLVGGSVAAALRARHGNGLPDTLAAKYTAQVAEALIYCHSKHVIHRDVKPENLLLGYDGEVRLADFGWSVHSQTTRRQTFCGTLDYLAPELIEGQPYTYTVDNWQLGVLLYEMLVGAAPFQEAFGGVMSNPSRVIRCEYTVPPTVCSGARMIIQLLLQRVPSERLALHLIAQQPWIQQHYSNNSSSSSNSANSTRTAAPPAVAVAVAAAAAAKPLSDAASGGPVTAASTVAECS
eukprot:13036-Heterococcus_DN1.PRE.1